ncbi:MAG: flagellum-specific ATP synthase FliI, partial [Pseudomonadota bacterium]
MDTLERLAAVVTAGAQEMPSVRIGGVVREVTPTYYRVAGLSRFLKLGDRVTLCAGGREHAGEVVRIDDAGATVKPFDGSVDIGIGARAYRLGTMALYPHESWKGRVINALGKAVDGLGPLGAGERAMPADAPPPSAMTRARVKKPLRTGVRVIDLFMPICEGQRIGIFAGSGVGKSTLLSMLA